MSGVFSTAIKHDWCDSNPVSRVEVPDVEEKPIEPLSIEEVERLEAAAQLPEHQEMQLSLHLMLYCGIRPTEVSRINPERDIDWQNQRVVVRPTTSKTGGGRVVPLRKAGDISIRTIPRCWVHRWRALRKAAGWSKEAAHPWQPTPGGPTSAATPSPPTTPRTSATSRPSSWKWGIGIPTCCVRGTCTRETIPKRRRCAISVSNFGLKM